MTKSASPKKTPTKKSKKNNLPVEPTSGATVEDSVPPAEPTTEHSKKERKSAVAILKLASLQDIPALAPGKVLNAIAEPSEKAVQELIASAKEIGLDIAHGSWQKKARALKAGESGGVLVLSSHGMVTGLVAATQPS